MPHFEWRGRTQDTLDMWPTVYSLYVPPSIVSYATLVYLPQKGTWALRLRDWEQFQDVEEAQVCAPPKEYVESLVLLSYDIKGANG